MIVICEECGKKYRIDPHKIQSAQARFKCRACSHLITVDKPTAIGDAPSEVTDTKSVSENMDAPASPPHNHDAAVSSAQPTKTTTEGPPASSPQASKAERLPKKSGLGLTAKVVLLMLLVSLIPGGLYFALSSKQTNDRIFFDNERFGKQMADALTTEVEGWIDKNIRVLKTAAAMPAMQSMNRYEQEGLLKTIQQQYPWMYLVFTTDNFGIVF